MAPPPPLTDHRAPPCTSTQNEEGGEAVLLPDVSDDAREVARMVTPTPHGVGPLPVSFLVSQVVALAEGAWRADVARRGVEEEAEARRGVKVEGEAAELPEKWSVEVCAATGVEVARREVFVASFAAAAELVRDVAKLADAMGHQPSVTINQRRECEDETGRCAVVIQTTSFTAKALTKADEYSAQQVESLLQARWVKEEGGMEQQVEYLTERFREGKPFYEPTWMKHTRQSGDVWNQ